MNCTSPICPLSNLPGSTLHNTVVLAGQAAASLLLLGVALDTGAVALDLLALSMVFVLVAQVLPTVLVTRIREWSHEFSRH